MDRHTQGTEMRKLQVRCLFTVVLDRWLRCGVAGRYNQHMRQHVPLDRMARAESSRSSHTEPAATRPRVF